MSQLSNWLDSNLTHSTERREAREKSDKQIAEFDKLKKETKDKADQLQKEKTYEENRASKSKMRRLRGGSKKSGFLNETSNTVSDKLG